MILALGDYINDFAFVHVNKRKWAPSINIYLLVLLMLSMVGGTHLTSYPIILRVTEDVLILQVAKLFLISWELSLAYD